MKPIEKLKPMPPTPEEEMCHCKRKGPILLRSALGPFPFYCMECNGEIPIEELQIDDCLAEEVAQWLAVHDSLFYLWLDSDEYEAWAKERLLDVKGKVNVEGLRIAREFDKQRETFFWFFQDTDDESYVAPKECPFCKKTLKQYGSKNFQICSSCKVAV